MSTLTQEKIHDDQEESSPSTRRNINDFNDQKIGKPSLPPVIGSFTDRDQLYCRLRVNCAMATGASITSLEETS